LPRKNISMLHILRHLYKQICHKDLIQKRKSLGHIPKNKQ
jgi:hypothetical protein